LKLHPNQQNFDQIFVEFCPNQQKINKDLLDNRVIHKVKPSLEVKLGFKPMLFVKNQVKK